MKHWEKQFKEFILEKMESDPAHDITHLQRVVLNATTFAKLEGASLEVVIPAAWLHDCVNISKDSPNRKKASQLSATEGILFLETIQYPKQYFDSIIHAIEAHSFSAEIPPKTIEAKVLQDADRIDALGAIGVSRCIVIGGVLNRRLYDPDDPFCRQRKPDDLTNTIDHFYSKLLKLADSMQTTSAKKEAQHRTEFMLKYLDQLRKEVFPENK